MGGAVCVFIESPLILSNAAVNPLTPAPNMIYNCVYHGLGWGLGGDPSV